MHFVPPRVEVGQDGQRASSSLLGSSIRIEVALFAVGFDLVQLGEVQSGIAALPSLASQQCAMELAANVHATTESALGWDSDDSLPGLLVLDLSRVPSVALGLAE